MTEGLKQSSNVTTKQVAEYCGVDRSTVSRVLSGDSRISEKTAGIVRTALEQLGYNPEIHVAARRLKLKQQGKRVQNNVLACLISLNGIHEELYYGRLFQGVLHGTATHGFAMLATDTPDHFDGSSFRALLNVMARDEVDGVIAYPIGHNTMLPELRKAMGRSAMPIATMLQLEPGCVSVSTDDRSGAFAATSHLLELGHRAIVYLPPPLPVRQGAERKAGVLEAYERHGIDPTSNAHFLGGHGKWYDHDQLNLAQERGMHDSPDILSLSEYLRQHPEITAIQAWNDPNALFIWLGLQASGWRIPDDLSIIGFDDTRRKTNDEGVNQLTTVHLPLEEVGETAACLLIEQIASGQYQEHHVVLPTQFMLRESTAPPRRSTR